MRTTAPPTTSSGGEPHCPTASWELIHGAVHTAKQMGQSMHVGPIVSSDVFYNPDENQYERWSKRGVLAVEMEASALFTVGALRGVQSGCLLTVSDIVVEGEFKRITRRRAARGGRPDDARRARDGHGRREALSKTVFLVNPASANGSTGRRWPEIRPARCGGGPQR